MGKALDAEERLHVCFKIITSMMSAKHFKCDLFHFRDLFKIRYNSLRCVIVFVVRKQLLWHYFNELSIFVVYRDLFHKSKNDLFFWLFVSKNFQYSCIICGWNTSIQTSFLILSSNDTQASHGQLSIWWLNSHRFCRHLLVR